MGKPLSVSVVVPVYNGAMTLPELVSRLSAVLPALAESFEVLFVNDGSHDRSWEAICDLTTTYKFVRGINLMRNYGQHNALLCGIRSVNNEIIVTIDDDLQHPPEEISKLLDKLAEGYDVVYGVPLQQQHGLWRDLASQATKLALQSAMGAETARKVSPFRAFRAAAREAFVNYSSPSVSIDVLLTWSVTRFAAIPVRHDPRRSGISNYSFRRLAVLAIDMMIGFSTLPLRLATLIGFGFTFFGVGVLVYVIGRYVMQGGSVPGFPFLASVIAIFSGAQLFALGIMGEYLARIHLRSMGQPAYVIRQTLEQDKEVK